MHVLAEWWPVSIPDRDTLDLNGAAFGASNYMREIMGYAPVEPDGSVNPRRSLVSVQCGHGASHHSPTRRQAR